MKFKKLPRHVGLIPDGNRRWARSRGLLPQEGYAEGVVCGLRMLDDCLDLKIEEVSLYGFTMDNNKRPKEQRVAFSLACEQFVETAMRRDISLLVVGDDTSNCFPEGLKSFAKSRQGSGRLKVNMLVNYGWNWDLQTALCAAKASSECRPITELMASADISRIDLLVRWGGTRRLSGFLPIQTVYSDFFVVDEMWPDYKVEQFHTALEWYQRQDQTLGG
jgi:undecaprenyl diphosphate synthase